MLARSGGDGQLWDKGGRFGHRCLDSWGLVRSLKTDHLKESYCLLHGLQLLRHLYNMKVKRYCLPCFRVSLCYQLLSGGWQIAFKGLWYVE